MPGIHLSAVGRPPTVTVDRGDGVAELFWQRLRAELAVDARASASRLQVPADRFLANRGVLRQLCQQYGVAVSADEAGKALLARTRDEEGTLQGMLRSPDFLSEEQALERLDGGRFVRELRPFQRRDLARLLSLPHGANFSVPGAGKTTVAYATYEVERLTGRVERLLVVAPLSAFDAWRTEPAECLNPEPEVWPFETGTAIPATAEVVLVNYSKLLNDDSFERLLEWVTDRPTQVVLDEAHRVKKGRSGAWGRACLDLSWYAVRRDVLSGTPAPNHPSDLEALLDFVWPGQARRLLPDEAFITVTPPGTAARIAQRIAPLFVRTRKSELGLDDPCHRIIRLPLSGLHREIYLAVTNQYSGAIPALRRDRYRLAEMQHVVMYLLEAATNPALLPLGSSPSDPPTFQHPRAPVPADSDLVALLNNYGRYETPAKFIKLAELVRDNAEAGRKTLVWSNFVRNLEMLRTDFARYEPAMIHGGVPSEVSQPTADPSREAELARFRQDDGCMVLLANPAAMSEGVSLHQTCHDAIYLERTFNAGQYLQSVDRIHRLGLAEGTETRITFLIMEDTVDEVVHRRVEEKAVRLGEMLDDPDIATMALPDEDDLETAESGLGQPIDNEADVAALFAHLRGEDAE